MGTRNQLWSIAKMSVTGGVIGITISDRYVTVVAIKGHSMHPTMTGTDSALRGDIVLAEKGCLDQYKFSRGDVILFKCPSNHKEVFVKRLIGLPGEWIQLPASSEIIKVPQGHCWVEGDNAARSWDSRSFGPKSCELVARYTELKNQQVQLNLNLKLAQENLKKAQEEAKEKLEEALKKKDQDLAEAQKEASSKRKLAEEKLASVGTLEQENSRLKTALETANRDASRLKKEKMALHDKAGELAGKVKDLEAYLGGLAKKLFVTLEEFCQNFEEETSRVEPSLDPVNSLLKDEVAMNVLRLESRTASVVDYLARLKVAMSRIDTSLWPGTTL
ncbi:hypothetical protein VPH35_069344 [Triticum aestivum]